MIEITNKIRKTVASLSQSKHRRRQGLFKAEGTKCVLDTIGHFRIKWLIATEMWMHEHPEYQTGNNIVKVSARDMEQMSDLITASEVIAVYEIPDYDLDTSSLTDSLVIALDSVQDPGNLGTIMRTADWFGIRDIICSRTTVDVYSPKVIQATMGAVSRVRVHYCDLPEVLGNLRQKGVNIYGTFLEGDNVYTSRLSHSGVIVMGNEGQGISDDVRGLVSDKLFIPPYPIDADTSESLNVATATAIILSEFRRTEAYGKK